MGGCRGPCLRFLRPSAVVQRLTDQQPRNRRWLPLEVPLSGARAASTEAAEFSRRNADAAGNALLRLPGLARLRGPSNVFLLARLISLPSLSCMPYGPLSSADHTLVGGLCTLLS